MISLFNELSQLKLALKMAHPWLLLNHFPNPKKGRALVVGPPPGPINDRSVYEAIKSAGFSNFDILVKKRGNILSLKNFGKKGGLMS